MNYFGYKNYIKVFERLVETFPSIKIERHRYEANPREDGVIYQGSYIINDQEHSFAFILKNKEVEEVNLDWEAFIENRVYYKYKGIIETEIMNES